MTSARISIAGALAALLAGTTACSLAKSRSYVSPEADFSIYRKVGVIPFRNQTEDRLASDKLTELCMTEMLIAGGHNVMDPGQFAAIVSQVAKSSGSPTELAPATLTQIGTVAEVEGIFMGTVHDYKMVPVGGDQYPMISMTVKFVDTATGTIAWQHSLNLTGGPNLPIVSIGETFTLGELSQKACKAVVKDFYRKASK